MRASPPGETTHWTAAALAKETGISVSSVQRIWRSHGLQPHRMGQFKLSTDPKFAEKVRDIVGLYVDPPAHAVVLSVEGYCRCYLHKRGGRGGIDSSEIGAARSVGRVFHLRQVCDAPRPQSADVRDHLLSFFLHGYRVRAEPWVCSRGGQVVGIGPAEPARVVARGKAAAGGRGCSRHLS
jgi:hypothetical protein